MFLMDRVLSYYLIVFFLFFFCCWFKRTPLQHQSVFVWTLCKQSWSCGVCSCRGGGLVLSKFLVFRWFPSHPESTLRGANFGISLCLWIGVHKRPLIALSLTLTQSSTPPLLYSHSFSLSLSFPFSIWASGRGPLVINKMGRDGE